MDHNQHSNKSQMDNCLNFFLGPRRLDPAQVSVPDIKICLWRPDVVGSKPGIKSTNWHFYQLLTCECPLTPATSSRTPHKQTNKQKMALCSFCRIGGKL
jgi:hypothetical protein